MRILVGGTVAAILAAVVVGVFAYGGGGVSLANAAERMQGKSLRSSVTMAMTVEGTPVTMHGKLLQSADLKRFQMNLKSEDTAQTLVAVDGDLWMGGLAFKTLLPKGKRWIYVQDGARSSLDTMSFEQLLAFMETGTDIEERGQAEIDGVRVTHYAGTVDFKAALEKAGLDEDAYADLLEAGTAVMPIECWIDDSGMPVRIKTGMTVEGQKVTMTVDDLEFDVPTDSIQAPPTDETVSADEVGMFSEG